MAKGEFEEIKRKLYNHEVPVDSGLWQDIQGNMRRREIRKIFYGIISSAAVIAAIFMAITSVEVQRLRNAEYFAQEISPVPVPQTQIQLPESQIADQPVSSADIAAFSAVSVSSAVSEVPAAPATPEVSAAPETPETTETTETTEATEAKEVHKSLSMGEVSVQEHKSTLLERSSGKMVENATAAQVYYDEWAELQQEDKESGKRFTMAFVGGVMPGSSASVAGQRIMAVSPADGAQHSYMIEQVSDTKYSLPLNLGVQVQFPLGENLALGVGVSYTMLKSKFDCLVNKVRYNGQQTLHYVGIPVNVYGKVAQRNRFVFYVNGGAMLEKGVRAKYKFSSYKDSYSSSTKMDGLQFSVNAGLGVEYNVSDYVGLYFEPNIIYFTNSDMQYCIRTDQPLQIKAELGCRFHF